MSISPVYRVVFDIDEVLAFRKCDKPELAAFIEQHGMVVSAIVPHYVPPGIKEFIRLLFQTGELQVSFFSSGAKIRNDLFVQELLRQSLGENADIDLEDRVLSCEDLTIGFGKDRFDLDSGEHQKDLTKVTRDISALANAILIDDDESFVADGQVQHFLQTECNSACFRHWKRKRDLYGPDGMRFVEIAFEQRGRARGWMRDRAQKGNCIGVMMEEWTGENGQNFTIGFVDQETHEYREVPIEDFELRYELAECYIYSTKSDDYPSCILDKIRSIVESNRGRTKKIWRAPNRIFFVAGLFFTAMKSATVEGISLSESLHRLYRKEIGKDGSYSAALRRMTKHDELYWRGLKLLQTINPDLQMTSPHLFCIPT